VTERVPVTLLAGFLGSGKTTLLNRILTERHGERIAVVVNEFGEVGIDGDLVVGSREDVVQLVNGCLCCTVRGDLAATITSLVARRGRRLLGRLAFDRIVIEASGMASPGPVAQTLELVPELSETVALDAVVMLVHAGHVAHQLREHPAVAEQVGYADRILLNACDLAGEAELEEAERLLRAANAVAPIERAVRAEVDVGELLAVATRDPGGWKLEGERDPGEVVHTSGEGAVRTVTLSADEPVDIHRLKMWLQFVAARRTHELLRAKGLLACEGFDHPVVVQGVYQLLELGPGPGERPERSVLVLIGRDLDSDELERGWRNVLGEAGN
jgi:G3E family GTPase